MFTGIIETVGRVAEVRQLGGDLRLIVAAPDYQDRLVAIADSIAINGLCLTVVDIEGSNFAFDVSQESLQHSLIGDWQVGSKVNLEMALLPTTRLGGHLVSGHVDGLAQLVELQGDARSWRMRFTAPDELSKYIARKGSITINGASLTVNSVESNLFAINVIPHTFEVTTLGELRKGDRVHIEVDLIARYLERLLSGKTSVDSNFSQSFLAEHGFA